MFNSEENNGDRWKTHSSGIPWAMMLFTLVQHERGKLAYNRGEGYALCATINSCMDVSIEMVVTPAYRTNDRPCKQNKLSNDTREEIETHTLTNPPANSLTLLASLAAFLSLPSSSDFNSILPSPSHGSPASSA